MQLPEQAAMPVVMVQDGFADDTWLAIFYGEEAYTYATEFISTLPNYTDGRYGITPYDVQCFGCGLLFWHEAWVETTEAGWWTCPGCRRPVTEEDTRKMQTPIPELESQ